MWDRFRDCAELGAGAAGRVVSAWDREREQRVAIKISGSSEWDNALRREYRYLQELGHQLLPVPFDALLFDGRPAYSMEWIDGPPLQRAVAGLSVEQFAELLQQGLLGLDVLHRRGTLHGDVKPEHLLVQSTGAGVQLRILDLGLAASAADQRSGVLRGTAAYLSSHNFAGRALSVRSDLFALGRSFAEAFDALSEREGPIAERLRSVLERLCLQDEDARYQSCDHALRDLVAGAPRGAVQFRPPLVGRAGPIAELEQHLVTVAQDERPKLVAVQAERGMGRRFLVTAFCQLVATRPRPARVDQLAPDQLRLRAEEHSGAVPTVVVLEGECSAERLRAVRSAMPRRAPLLIVGAVDAAQDLSGVECSKLGLEPIERVAVRKLLLAFPGADVNSPVVRALEDGCEGHPGYLVACMRRLAADATSQECEAVLQAELVPRAVRRAEERLARLTPVEQEACELLSCLSGSLSREAVDVLLADARLSTSLERLAASGVLRRSGAGVTFRSSALRRGVLATLTAERRAIVERACIASLTRGARTFADRTALADLIQRSQERVSVAQLIRLARALLVGHHARRALVLVGQGLARAELAASERAQLEVLAARARVQRGDPDRASAHIQSARRACSEVVDPSVREVVALDCENVLALVQEARGQLRAARATLERAVTLACGEPEAFAPTYELLGQLHAQLGDQAAARAATERGLAALREPESDARASSLWNNLGLLASRDLDLERARALHERALAIRVRVGDSEGQSRSLTNLGSVARVLGDYQAARSNYEAALVIKRELGNAQATAVTLANLAALDRWLGNLADAIRQYEEVLAMRRQAFDLPGQARCLVSLASAWHQKGMLGRARELARSATQVARRVGQRDQTLIYALHTEAEVYWTLNQTSLARRCVAEALELCRTFHAPGVEALLVLLQVRLEARPQQADACSQLERAIELADSSREQATLAEALTAQAEILYERGDLHASARSARAARQLASKLEGRALSARIELCLGRLAGGDPDRASTHLRRAHALALDVGLPELQWQCCAEIGNLHQTYQRVQRALRWWQECIEVFRDVVLELEDEALAEGYLAQPQRARVCNLLDGWIVQSPA